MQNGNLPTSTPSGGGRPPSEPSPAGRSGGGEDASLDLASIVASLLRQKWVIVVTCLAVAVPVAAYTYMQPKVYQASSMVKVNPEGGEPAPVTEGIAGVVADGASRSLSSEMGVLRNSLDLARRVAKELRADAADDPQAEPFPVLVDAETGASLPVADVARRIRGKVGFEQQPERSIVEIVVESQRPEEAAAIANLYAEEYRKYSREKARASVQAARKFLEAQADEQRRKVDRLEARWERFVRENRVVEQGVGGEQLRTKYNELKARRDQTAFELEREQTQLKLLRDRLRELRPRLEESVIEEQAESGLRTEIQALEEKIAEMQATAANYYAENPDLEGDATRIERNFPELDRLLEKIEALESRKEALTRRLVEEVSGSERTTGVGEDPIEQAAELRSQITERQLAISQLQSQVSALDSLIAEYEAKLGGIPDQQIQREQLERKMKQAEAFQKEILSELQQLSIVEEAELGYVKPVQSAVTPSVPIRPNVRKNVILGVLLGLAFGIGLAFLREATDTRLRGPEDIEKKGYNLLGAVPTMDPEIDEHYGGRDVVEVEGQALSTRMIPLLNPWSPITENYRLIRANLRRDDDGGPRTLLVTSAQKEEGKTVTAVNLALTEALSGQRTLLIDADMRRPTAHDLLDMPRTPGLSNVLDEMPEAKCWQTPVDGLGFIPAGAPTRGPTSILDSGDLRRLLEEMRLHFDSIVLDTPPTEAASDAVVIGTQADVSALVVSAADRDVRALDAAMNALHTADVSVAGVVLNQFDGEVPPGGNRGYSYYGHDGEYAEYRLSGAGNGRAPEAPEEVVQA